MIATGNTVNSGTCVVNSERSAMRGGRSRRFHRTI